MLTGRSIEEVEGWLGKTGRTRTADLIRFLRFQGWECPDRLLRFTGVQSIVAVPCIAKVVWKNDTGKVTNSHWVVRTYEGRWFDPATQLAGQLSPACLITSVLPLTKSAAMRFAPVQP